MSEKATGSGASKSGYEVTSAEDILRKIRLNEPLDDVILVDKPKEMSSFGVVARIRSAISRRILAETGEKRKVKVGHAGTLDPFATGLLIILVGKATKKAQDFLKLDKEYEAEICLGKVSSTGDPEGEIREYKGADDGAVQNAGESEGHENTSNISDDGEEKLRQIPKTIRPSEGQIERALKSFLGESEQTVPRFSAVKINGRRAYDLARKGEKFETPTRKIKIYNIEVIEYGYPVLKIRTRVSSGTYIRTLGEDIGKRLGTGAYLLNLRRTKIGGFDIREAETLDEISDKITNLDS